MTKFNPRFGTAMTDEQYAGEWKQSAAKLSAGGNYTWMREQLGAAAKILEVGCGSGESTEVLVKAGSQVLVVEVNEHCAAHAVHRLRAKGINVDYVSLSQLGSLVGWTAPGVKVLIADLLSPDVATNLPEGYFDAIVCWLIGSYPGHIGNVVGKEHDQFDGSEMATFRLELQRRCFQLGSKVLVPKGRVHVVDRLVIQDWKVKDEARQRLAEMMGETAGSEYQISKAGTLLRRLESLNHSQIQYVVPEAAAHGLTVLASSLAQRA